MLASPHGLPPGFDYDFDPRVDSYAPSFDRCMGLDDMMCLDDMMWLDDLPSSEELAALPPLLEAPLLAPLLEAPLLEAPGEDLRALDRVIAMKSSNAHKMVVLFARNGFAPLTTQQLCLVSTDPTFSLVRYQSWDTQRKRIGLIQCHPPKDREWNDLLWVLRPRSLDRVLALMCRRTGSADAVVTAALAAGGLSAAAATAAVRVASAAHEDVFGAGPPQWHKDGKLTKFDWVQWGLCSPYVRDEVD
jgi:hypothetical protein